MILYREFLILIVHSACMNSARLISGASHGPTCQPHGPVAHPTHLGVPLVHVGPWWLVSRCPLAIKSYLPRKKSQKIIGTFRRRLRGKTWAEHFCSPALRFCRGNIPPGGELEAFIITNSPIIVEIIIFIDIFTSTILSQNPSSSLVFNLCIKPQIDTWGC